MIELEKQFVDAVLGAFAVGGSPIAPRPGEVDYVGTIETLVTHSNPVGRIGVYGALWLVATGPMWLWRRPETILALTPDDRARLVEELVNHEQFAVREMALLMKIQAGMAIMGTASVRARTDYDVPRSPKRRLGVLEGGL